MRLPALDTAQPYLCPQLMAFKPFVFASCPPDQYTIEVLQGRIHGRFVEESIVVDPPTKYRIEHPGEIVERLVTAVMQRPSSHDVPYLFGRLVAHRRAEVDEVPPPAVL